MCALAESMFSIAVSIGFVILAATVVVSIGFVFFMFTLQPLSFSLVNFSFIKFLGSKLYRKLCSKLHSE